MLKNRHHLFLFLTFIFCALLFFSGKTLAITYRQITTDGWTGIHLSSRSPTITDLDGDGLIDLLVGKSTGGINHYEQDSANATTFTFRAGFFSGVNVGFNSNPSATDLDGDGLIDLLVGEDDGNINHYEQHEANSTTFDLVTETFNSSMDVGSASTPTATDLDGDGLIDLLVGEGHGNINHYEQHEANSTTFDLVTETFNSSMDVGSASTPTVTDLDGDGLIDLLVGEQNGNINHYEQHEANSTTFDLVTETFNSSMDVGVDSTPTVTDLDSDGLIDFLVGEYDGNINHYEQREANSTTFDLVTDVFFNAGGDNPADVGALSTPTATDLDGDGLIDLLVGEHDGNINHYEQHEANSTTFDLVTETFNNSMDVGSISTPTVTDLDGDGLIDLLVGQSTGHISHYEQHEANSTTFDLAVLSPLLTRSDGTVIVAGDSDGTGGMGYAFSSAVMDLDDDGKLDLLLCLPFTAGNIEHYEQSAENSTTFDLVTTALRDGEGVVIRSTESASFYPLLADLDGDGLLDLLLGLGGTAIGGLTHYELATAGVANFELVTTRFNNMSFNEDNTAPTARDVDGDGLLDLLMGNFEGTFSLFLASNCGNGTVGESETCDDGNGVDNDTCSNSCESQSLFYQDSDGDGYGNSSASDYANGAPEGYVTNNTDCNDTDSSVHPGTTEINDDLDNDCDGETDEGCIYYEDADGDGTGNLESTEKVCTQSDGFVADRTDCNDSDATINTSATETCGDNIDQNCDDLDLACVSESNADDDDDGIADTGDNCALLANADQLDTDSDGVGDVCDNDDNILDAAEGTPSEGDEATSTTTSSTGCGCDMKAKSGAQANLPQAALGFASFVLLTVMRTQKRRKEN